MEGKGNGMILGSKIDLLDRILRHKKEIKEKLNWNRHFVLEYRQVSQLFYKSQNSSMLGYEEHTVSITTI